MRPGQAATSKCLCENEGALSLSIGWYHAGHPESRLAEWMIRFTEKTHNSRFCLIFPTKAPTRRFASKLRSPFRQFRHLRESALHALDIANAGKELAGVCLRPIRTTNRRSCHAIRQSKWDGRFHCASHHDRPLSDWHQSAQRNRGGSEERA